MEFVSYAQHGEDVVLWRALGHRDRVTYVDVGAYDPTYESVTRAWYERGWRGVNIEPQPGRIAAFDRDRPEDMNLAVAIGDHDGTTILAIPATPGWATIHEPRGGLPDGGVLERIEVPLRRLDTLLPELGVDHVDVLKIDAEGAEPDVVRGLLGGGLRPTVCIVEGVAPARGREAGDEAVKLLVTAGYRHCMFDGLNHYLTTDPRLTPALSVPASPADGYVRDSVVQLVAERRQLHETIASLAAENLTLREAASAPELAAPGVDAPPQVDNEESTPASVDQSVVLPHGHPPVLESATVPHASSTPAFTHDLPHVADNPPLVEPTTRRQRRRATFGQLLAARADATDALAMGTSVERQLPMNLAALKAAEPGEAVTDLFRSILHREPDADGFDVWTTHLKNGLSIVQAAHAIAESDEAREATPERRQRTAHILRRLDLYGTLQEIGVLGAAEQWPYRPGHAADEIFVEALFEVALRRAPSIDERSFESDKLAAGLDREWMFRAFADRPDVRDRLLGRRVTGPRSLVRRWRAVRTYRGTFRAMVIAAETRRVDELVRSLHAIESELGPHTKGGH